MGEAPAAWNPFQAAIFLPAMTYTDAMLKLRDSYSKKLQVFRPQKGTRVTMYNCGPTVYDHLTIGNLRSFLFADVLRRYLAYRGFRVEQVMNITDVGHALGDVDAGRDKVEEAAAREDTTPQAIAEKFTKIFFEDIRRLNILPAAAYPRATEHVGEMIALIAVLLKKGFAYESGGDVYFDLSRFPRYGRLSGNTKESLISGHRVEVNDRKKHPYDFALWIKNPRHLMQWDAPWGRGYPGWHIECSAMSVSALGPTIDIHTGGEDNKFPHHEAEIAQSEAATGKPFVRYWLHAAHLLVNGEKMSKSLGNYLRLDDLIAKGYEPRAVRYALVASHYRDTQNFTLASLDAAVSALDRLDAFWSRLHEGSAGSGKRVSMRQILAHAKKGFMDAMDADLNVPKALGALFSFVHEANAALDRGVSALDRLAARTLTHALVDDVLGIELQRARAVRVPAEVERLVAEREAARTQKDFARADGLREQIEVHGYAVKDTPEGPRVRKR